MSNRLNSFLGGSPLGVLLRLLIISGIVGFVMHWLGFYPQDVVYWVVDSARYIYASGFALLGNVFEYILFGAMIVIPIFLLSRLLKSGGGRQS